MTLSQKNSKTLLWLGIIPIVAYYVQLFVFGVNVPWGDDYNVVLEGVLDWQKVNGFQEGYEWWVSFYSFHRISFVRLTFMLQYWLFGYVDFHQLILLGSLPVFGMVWMLGKFLKVEKPYHWLILVAVLYAPQGPGVMLWACTVINAYYSLFFSMLYVWAIARPTGKGWAFLWYIIAVLGLGYGMFLPIVGVIILALEKNWKWLGIQVAVAILVAVWYLNGVPADDGDGAFDFSRIHVWFLYSFGLVGSSLQILGLPSLLSKIVCIAGGFAFLGSAGYIVWKSNVWRENRPLLGLFLLLFMILGIVATSRWSVLLETDVSFYVHRYRIYSILLLAVMLVWWWRWAESKFDLYRLKFLFLVFLFGWMASWHFGWWNTNTERRDLLLQGTHEFHESGSTEKLYIFNNPEERGEIFKESVKKGIYNPPKKD